MIGCTRIACCTQMKKLGAPVQQCQESVWSPDRNKDANTKCLNHSKTREDVAITCCNFNNGKKKELLSFRRTVATNEMPQLHPEEGLVSS